MKKLNKSELEALADKIFTKMKNENAELIKAEKAKNLLLNKSRRDKIMYDLNNMSVQMKDYITSQMSYSSRDFMKAGNVLEYVENKMLEDIKFPFKSNCDYGTKQAIKNELILAQIEANSLVDLIVKVEKSFREV